ncbi:sensor histidine kinase [Acetonema longum]|uniref:histidine kinase n=1 Tax=Acetonema longum DSM 6540 TaxID=1009370 RepID=F7NJ96_9FIRM|nr:sensor histidine kinase [Acetonema longum]EGO63844.1 integral membrane sensor signal transduction histidine kinase [Acetonema longum DSM 6540]
MDRFTKKIASLLNRSRFLRNQPLSWKLFVFSSILIVIPMLVVGILSYKQSADSLEQQAILNNRQAIEPIETHLEYYVRDFESSSLKIINHPDMQRLLHMRTVEEVEQSRIRYEIQDLIRAEMYSRPDISHITLILDNILAIDTLELRSPYPASQLRDEYWYVSAPHNGLPIIISRSIDWKDHKEPVITLARRIQSPTTLQMAGMLIFDINFRRLREVSEAFNTGERYFYILDAGGHYIYHPDANKIGQKTEKPDKDIILSQKNGTLVSSDPEPDFLTYSFSPNLGWTFVTSIPYAELRKEAGRIGQAISWTVVLSLAAAYILGMAFASAIISPIRQLQQFMRKIEVGDFSAKIQVDSNDEIGQLSQGFNKMVMRLSDLMEEIYFSRLRETEASLRQKEMEIKVLQSQINPHFLCNALETIRGMALEQNREDIATMAASLGALLRYNLRNTAPVVLLREELNFCRVYLQIQQFRFESSFSYTMNIPEWALDLPIVKFSLQPLVENCLLHSLQSNGHPTLIEITAGRKTVNSFLVTVSDTGAGMPQPVLEKLRQDLTEKDILAGGDNLGIINVHRRIIHLFGPEYGIQVESRLGQGTQVFITLPATLAHNATGGHENESHSAGG